jgi:hypothetical protein
MNKERENRMLAAAKILSGPINKIDSEDLDRILAHGNIQGAFICGVRWADRNPDSPWYHVEDRMPEDSLPVVSNPTKAIKKPIKVMVCMMNGSVMQATRRCSIDGKWYFNIPMRMRDQITHWMPIPPVPEEIRNENKQE